ncbi:hypothetical protein OY671_008597, partial [Metschnikowia pulcherrima]
RARGERNGFCAISCLSSFRRGNAAKSVAIGCMMMPPTIHWAALPLCLVPPNPLLSQPLSGSVDMRGKRRIAIWAGVAGLASSAGAGPAGASSDYSCDPVWALSDSGFSCGNRALSAPGNDTRVNSFSLRRTAPVGKAIAYAKPTWEERGFGHSFFGWHTLRDTYAGRSGAEEAASEDQPLNSRCNSAASGQTAFEAALAAAKGIPEGERTALRGARATSAEKCSEISDNADA